MKRIEEEIKREIVMAVWIAAKFESNNGRPVIRMTDKRLDYFEYLAEIMGGKVYGPYQRNKNTSTKYYEYILRGADLYNIMDFLDKELDSTDFKYESYIKWRDKHKEVLGKYILPF